MRNKEQIYGRNDMILLDKHNKIYGSLGIIEPYVFDTKTGETIVMENPKKGKFEDVVTEFSVYGKSTQQTTKGINLLDPNKDSMEFIPYPAKAGTYFTLMTNGVPSEGGNILFKGEDDSEVWFPIEKGDFRVYRKIEKNVSGFHIQLSKTVGLKYMLAKGDIKEYEPYTGGKPSPSIEYPQEIVSAGDNGSINVDVDNNGYIQKGTYFDNIRPLPLARGYTYHIEGDTRGDSINCFVFNENKSFFTSANLYDYGYGNKKLTIVNDTGVVDKECCMPMNYNGNGYTFTVMTDGLYLYQGVNHRSSDTDDFYIGHHVNIADEEYEKQTLTLSTPNGLPGISASIGGNYTDANGQQWVTDEIDLARGKYIQRTKRGLINKVTSFNGVPKNGLVEFLARTENSYKGDAIGILCNKLMGTHESKERIVQEYGLFYIRLSTSRFKNGDNLTIEEANEFFKENPLDVIYILETPIERDLTPEEITAYKALHTNYPTTTIVNDENAGMKVTYKQLESKTKAVN